MEVKDQPGDAIPLLLRLPGPMTWCFPFFAVVDNGDRHHEELEAIDFQSAKLLKDRLAPRQLVHPTDLVKLPPAMDT